MRIVIQRVKEAEVKVAGQTVGQIAQGMLIFLGLAREDTPASADYLVRKIMELRIFEDTQGKMNLSAQEVGAQFLVVSQFTLYGNCDRGRRPSFDEAADPAKGEELYNYFVTQLKATQAKVETGQFRATMDVSLINDGPVTFVIDSKS
jgi:D-tyrosyl-tRNA(Tyr) deacylase